MKRLLPRLCAGALLAVGMALTHAAAAADGYPAKPVRLIVPFPAGGAADVLARVISLRAAERLGQAIVIDNRPGAGGVIGSEAVAKAEPDGYTILMATGSTHSIGPLVHPEAGYRVERDFSPVIDMARTTTVLVVPAALPARNLAEFIALAKARPGQLNFGSSGNGTMSHLSGELLKAQAGVFLTHIPYRGTGLVFSDMVSGQVQMLMDNFVTSQGNIRDGRLRVLGVAALHRLPALPDVPTLDEQGLKGFDASNWLGIYAPRGTPPDVIARLNAAYNQALREPELRQRLASLGAEPTGGTPQQLSATVAADTAKWRRLITERHLVLR